VKKELFIKNCIRCKLAFQTDKEHETVCPDCQKFSQKNRKNKAKQPKRTGLSISQVVAALEKHNREHGTCFTYGQFSELIRIGKIEI
jgi:hypothetical protein